MGRRVGEGEGMDFRLIFNKMRESFILVWFRVFFFLRLYVVKSFSFLWSLAGIFG